MKVLADLLLVLAALPLLHLVVRARPMRGESFVGMHLLTLPIALVLAFAWGIHLAVEPLPWPSANVLLWVFWPGHVVAMVVLPMAAYGGRGAQFARVACVAALAAAALIGHGGAWNAALPVVGAAVTAMLGAGGTLAVLLPLLQLVRRKIPFRLRRGPREPSEFERTQAEFQRDAWQKVPADAGVEVLLGFTRSFAPEVQGECLERLRTRADLVPALGAVLTGECPDDALHYVVHQFPHPRGPLAPAVAAMLAARRREIERNIARGDDQLPVFTVGALECGLAVLEDGGDILGELTAWRELLGRVRGGAPFAKTLARWMRKFAPA
jgi:hypothetical protein